MNLKFTSDERPDLNFIHQFTCSFCIKGKKYLLFGADEWNPFGWEVFKDIGEFKEAATKKAKEMVMA